MALSSIALLCISVYFIAASRAADTFVADAPNPEPAPADAFLLEHGIEDYGEIFYYKHSENVTDCLRSADARARLLQICQGREVFEQCAGGVDLTHFYDCKGRRCVSSFSKNRSRCLLEKSGAGQMLTQSLGTACNAAWKEHPLASWQKVPWTVAIGDTNDFHCLTALPLNTSLERRFICDETGDPIIQHQMLFESDAFLRTNERKVRCVAMQHCGLPKIFAGEVACYEVSNDTSNDDPSFPIQEQADEISEDTSSSSSIHSIGTGYYSFCISFICAMWIVLTTIVM